VPVISVFFGIVIRMFYREHGIAHFHAELRGSKPRLHLTAESSPVALVLGRRSGSSRSGQPRTAPSWRPTGSG